MLFDLLKHDISNFEVRDVPMTKGLIDQKRHSLRGSMLWLEDCLFRGKIEMLDWPETLFITSKDNAYQDYLRFSAQQKEYKPEVNSVWAKTIVSVFKNELRTFRPKAESGGRPWHWELPGLTRARKAFEIYLGASEIDWDPGHDDPMSKDCLDQ